jgi:hypothetical protein
LYQEEDDDDNGMSPSLYLLVSLGDEILQYEILLPKGGGGKGAATAVVLCGRLDIPNFDQAGNSLKDMCNAMAVHHPILDTSGQQRQQRLLALGCESGLIRLYTIDNTSTSSSTSTLTSFTPFNLCQGHVQAVCAVHFANATNKMTRFVSSAKDGTARVWKIQGTIVRSEATLTCDCTDPNQKEDTDKRKNKTNRPPLNNPIMVRGCAFAGDNDEIIITVASPRRGAAFLSAWQCRDGSGVYALAMRTLISPVPVSAMAATTSSLSSRLDDNNNKIYQNTATTTHVALGTTDGTILLWNVNAWKLSRRYDTVHELPVTCIVIRPHFETVDGDETLVTTVHARSASADGKLANLSLQTTLPVQMRPARLSRPTDTLRRLAVMHRFLVTILIAYIISPILFDLYESGVGPCRPETLLVQQQRLPIGNNPSVSFQDKWWDVTTCIVEDVLWTPGHPTPY